MSGSFSYVRLEERDVKEKVPKGLDSSEKIYQCKPPSDVQTGGEHKMWFKAKLTLERSKSSPGKIKLVTKIQERISSNKTRARSSTVSGSQEEIEREQLVPDLSVCCQNKHTNEEGELHESIGYSNIDYSALPQAQEKSTVEPTVVTSQPTLSYFSYLGSRRRDPKFAEMFLSDIDKASDGVSFVNTGTSVVLTDSTEQTGTNNNSTESDYDCQTVIDVCSCMCCVKAACYHCIEEEGRDSSWVDQPCSCHTSSGCVFRWATLTAASVFLPCLMCYPVLSLCNQHSDKNTSL